MKSVLLTVFFMLGCLGSSASIASDVYDALDSYIERVCQKDCIESETLVDAATIAAIKTNLDLKLILAIVRVESSFQVHAKNGKSVGLMQLYLRYHKAKFQGKHYMDPASNIMAGAMVMKECMDTHHNSLRKASRCYNGGGDRQYYKKLLRAYSDISRVESLTSQQSNQP